MYTNIPLCTLGSILNLFYSAQQLAGFASFRLSLQTWKQSWILQNTSLNPSRRGRRMHGHLIRTPVTHCLEYFRGRSVTKVKGNFLIPLKVKKVGKLEDFMTQMRYKYIYIFLPNPETIIIFLQSKLQFCDLLLIYF